MSMQGRRIRWDRVIIVAVILIALIFALGSCISSCTRSLDKEDSSSQSGILDSLSSRQESSMLDSSTPDGSTPDSSASSIAENLSAYKEEIMNADAIYRGNLVLVNGENPSHLSEEELDLVKLATMADRPDCYQISYPAYTTVNSTVAAQFNRMISAYYAATGNKDIMFNYGYLAIGKEKSNPESASGLDIQLHLKKADGSYDYITDTGTYSWIYKNMAKYGFVLRYPTEKAEQTGEKGSTYSFRYVGLPHAAYMTEQNLCLEEYLDLLKNSYSYGTAMLEYTCPYDQKPYAIYYVPASMSGSTSVPVPTTGTYEISGNNVDGFIVTVARSSVN